MKFIDIVCAAFFARQNPVSTIAKPACMNMTRKPVISVQTMLMAILLCPTASNASIKAGLPGSLRGTSLAVPVALPVGSAAGGAGVCAEAAKFAPCQTATLNNNANNNLIARALFILCSFIVRTLGASSTGNGWRARNATFATCYRLMLNSIDGSS